MLFRGRVILFLLPGLRVMDENFTEGHLFYFISHFKISHFPGMNFSKIKIQEFSHASKILQIISLKFLTFPFIAPYILAATYKSYETFIVFIIVSIHEHFC